MDNLHLIQLNQYERPSITEERNRDWVGIGDQNDYYQMLIDAYMESTTNQSVINGIVNLIYGKGIDATDSAEKPDQYAEMKSIMSPDCLRKICNDLKLLGEASIQISYKGNRIGALSHFPRETLRAEKMNDNGDKDDKIIAVKEDSKFYKFNNIDHLNSEYPQLLNNIKYWFEMYKGKNVVKFKNYGSSKEANDLINTSSNFYKIEQQIQNK